MILRTCCFAAVIGCFPVFASAAETSAPPKLTEIRLERSGNADDSGPRDSLILRANGSALYAGGRNVERLGLYEGKLPNYGFKPPLALLEQLYGALRGKEHSTGKPTGNVTAVRWRILWDGNVEEIEDLCPGLDEGLWSFEMAVRGVAADVAWSKVNDDEAWPDPVLPKLTLAPEAGANDGAAIAALTANEWVAAGPVNILGAGNSRSLRFTRADGKLRALSVLHSLRSFAEPQQTGGATKPTDATQADVCRIEGPVLWLGVRPQTFTVTRDRRLVLNAVVAMGKGRWYYAGSERMGNGQAVRVEEYEFNFIDDPMKRDAGRGSMKSRIGDFPPKAEDMRFTLDRDDHGSRLIQIDVDGPSGVAHRARLGLDASGRYALMLDNANLDSVIFSPPEQGAGAAPTIDYQQAADASEWHWVPEDAGPLYCLFQAGDKYEVEMASGHADRFTIVFRVLRGGKLCYQWDGHLRTVFRIVDDRLYYPRFSPGSEGGTMVAVDLSTGKELWASPLQAVPVPFAHSKYRNLMNLSFGGEAVTVYGCESAGRYVEIKDVRTGKTLGHKVFAPMPNRGCDGCE